MKLQILSIFFFITNFCNAQDIPRKAWLGISGSFHNSRFVIDAVVPKSTMHHMDLRKHDTLLSINLIPITNTVTFNKAINNIRGGDNVHITFKRGAKKMLARINAVSKPFESSELADVQYDWVDYNNCKLRAITRFPKGKNNIPAVMLIPGYNCGSIENFSTGIYKRLIEAWLLAGYAVVTIEKSGLGDSYKCAPCSEVDLVTDIQTFDAGYKYMENLDRVDKHNLFIWGHSMGGVIAPEVAKLHHPKGVIVYATVFRPWSEFLLEMHRVQAPLDGKSYIETENYVRKLQKIYYEFFRLKKSPAELYNIQEYKETVVSELEYKESDNNMWGRHWRYWQQIDSLDLAASWSAVKCPVFSIFGGADYIACSEFEHQLIVSTVNSIHPGNAKHLRIEDIDHLLVQNKDWKEAHKNISNRAYRENHMHPDFANYVVEWMNSVKENQ